MISASMVGTGVEVRFISTGEGYPREVWLGCVVVADHGHKIDVKPIGKAEFPGGAKLMALHKQDRNRTWR